MIAGLAKYNLVRRCVPHIDMSPLNFDKTRLYELISFGSVNFLHVAGILGSSHLVVAFQVAGTGEKGRTEIGRASRNR